MKLLLTRIRFGDDSTLGKLYEVDHEGGLEFECYTLEDELREIKVPGETAIPTGEYEILPRDEGKMTGKYRDRYGSMHVGMAHLQKVAGFKYVYIHTGNTDDHTQGCLLVGTGYQPTREGEGNHLIEGSRNAYVPLYTRIVAAWARKEIVTVTIENDHVRDRIQ